MTSPTARPLPETVTVRCSSTERAVLVLLALAPAAVLAAVLASGSAPRPDTLKLAGVLISMAALAFFAFNSFRFLVRLDPNQLFHRELARRTIPLNEIKAIRVCRETKLLNLVSHLKIEVVGERARILVAWREKKLEPLLQALQSRFPDKVEFVDRLPDV